MISKYALLPLVARLRGKFGFAKAIRSAAAEVVELASADESPALPVISLPNEFERVVDAAPLSTIESQHELVTATRTKHGPTIAYRFQDAVLADHTLYAAGGYEVSRRGDKRPILGGTYEEYEQGQLCTYAASNIYFGHWLRDALAMELLAEQRGLVPLSYLRKPWIHEPGYRQLMNLSGRPVSFALVRQLWVIDDLGLNRSWIGRFRELRRRVRSAVDQGGPSRVFLSRGERGSARELINQAAIIELLVERGFTVVEPEELQPSAIAHLLASARVVVSVEGSALNHAQYAVPESAVLLVIQPPQRFNAFHKVLADFNNVRFSYVVADPADNGFTLPPERLLRTLDLVEAAMR
jgi:hypothetical protein